MGDAKAKEQQQQLVVEASDEELCDIEATFPINDNCKSADDYGQSLATQENNHRERDVNGALTMAASTNKMDEDAIMRCFNLSVHAHVENNGRVATFEPVIPISDNENRKDEGGKPDKQNGEIKKQRMESNSGKGEWFPASLSLPSWAINLP